MLQDNAITNEAVVEAVYKFYREYFKVDDIPPAKSVKLSHEDTAGEASRRNNGG